jgi:hypothetical protein
MAERIVFLPRLRSYRKPTEFTKYIGSDDEFLSTLPGGEQQAEVRNAEATTPQRGTSFSAPR